MAATLRFPSPSLGPVRRKDSFASPVLHCLLPVTAGTRPSRFERRFGPLSSRKWETHLRTRCQKPTQGVQEPFPPSRLTHLVQDFYDRLNKKDIGKLDELMDSNCLFEDMAFPRPFQKEEAHLFLKQLSTAMGQNVKFCIDDVYEEGKTNAGVRWHLEWKKRAIPLTKGCSFFYCSENADRLLIKKACVFIEPSVKPGAVVLEILKNITSFFDKYPKLAIWFLEKPHALLTYMLKAYKIFLEPFILPLLVYYTHLWTYAARLLSLVLNLVQNVLKPLM
ncbi:hypothetical protein HPP92_028531 [Vanilla planifolia]|uniref:SnoaL-like domain-containing protein n=1 Tax=Vanilla planifolia TaxID=51239 RepID=A0A835P8S6_VANPL|nr:hypothetical protein HPP92_028531 [Vanilla planifolia]